MSIELPLEKGFKKERRRTELKVVQISMQTRPEIYANSPALYEPFSRGNVSEQSLKSAALTAQPEEQ